MNKSKDVIVFIESGKKFNRHAPQIYVLSNIFSF